MAIIKVSSKEELHLPDKEFNHGFLGVIYLYGKNTLFKDLRGSGYITILDKLMNIKDTKYLVLPKDIYIDSEDVIGYTMKRIYGTSLDKVNLDTDVSILLNRFRLLLKDIYILSKNNLVNPDFSPKNILFDGYMYGIDFDNSVILTSVEEAYHIMSFDIFTVLLNYFINYNYHFIKENNDLSSIYKEIEVGNRYDYDFFWNMFFTKLENFGDKEIKSVKELRRELDGYYKSKRGL